MKKSYVPTTLGQFINENKAITLTRKYGQKEPVVVGSRAPLRNAVLSYVAENQKVSRVSLKRFIAGLNETSKNPAAAANMWLKRNAKFFESTTQKGVTTYKLSKLGEKLAQVVANPSVGALSEERKIKSRLHEKKENVKDDYSEKKDISEEGDEEETDESCNEETREQRIKRIVEQIKAKRSAALNEADEEEEEEGEEEVEDGAEEKEEGEEEIEDGEEKEEEGEELEDEGEEEIEDAEGDDRVEITEFIITVDDAEEAIAELAELGVEAEVSSDEMSNDEVGDEMDMNMDLGDEVEDGGDEVEDFDLDLGGDIEGDEAEEPDMEESVTGMGGFEKKVATQNHKATPNLVEDDDEFKMDDLDLDDEGGEDVEGDEEAIDELPMDTPEGGEDELADLEGEDDMEAPVTGNQIKVSAENWDVLKGWLEGKGVDIEDMFGGEIEVEGEEGVEDEISFDGLEDTGEEEKEEGEEEEAEGEEEEVEGEEEEVEESVTGMEKQEKEGWPNLKK